MTLVNNIPVTNVNNDQAQTPVAPAQAAVTVSPAPGPGGAPGGGNWGSVGVQKGFAQDCCSGPYNFVDQGQPFWLYLSAYNPGYDWRYTGGTMTDVLPLGLQVDVPAVAGGPAYTRRSPQWIAKRRKIACAASAAATTFSVGGSRDAAACGGRRCRRAGQRIAVLIAVLAGAEKVGGLGRRVDTLHSSSLP